ncbi:outer membrane lipoprotein carrier protein LolA [Cytobacillus sp. FJAT-53684]|uniref:Outer membrane lipoprotein carrier protein LolA n=1 Tax=Cytobacillus mangrovibacter TaxID=3299024 RepID=A0ABW6JZ99_9BACI
MDNKEKELSDYIDRLNAEQNPHSYENRTDSDDLDKLFQTVRMVRTLKSPTMPEADFQKKLTDSLVDQSHQKKPIRSRKWLWLPSIASVAALFILIMNTLLPLGDTNIVNAMEEAFNNVEAYHGALEIIETNANGESFTQAKWEVWANPDGQYYIEGLEGINKGLITVNNGEKKWQIQPMDKEVHIFPPFPDTNRFVFELGQEIQNVKNALSVKEIEEDTVAGRQASILEVTPHGGNPYKIWVDKETKLPLQKQTAMHNARQYTVTYTEIDFTKNIPGDLTSYYVPKGFETIDSNPEQLINHIDEIQDSIDFSPKIPDSLPTGYVLDNLAFIPNEKLIKQYYSIPDHDKKVIVLQKKTTDALNPHPAAIIAKMENGIAEIQSPVEKDTGILGGGGVYEGQTDLHSIRWQQEGKEFAVVGNASLDILEAFAKELTNGAFEMPTLEKTTKPQVDVPINMAVEENDQKSVDAGSSPWKLDPIFVTQIFVSLKISPEGITGDYPIQLKDLSISTNNGEEAIIEVSSEQTPIKRVYLKRLVRQDSTGIWTVIGYDPSDKK